MNMVYVPAVQPQSYLGLRMMHVLGYQTVSERSQLLRLLTDESELIYGTMEMYMEDSCCIIKEH